MNLTNAVVTWKVSIRIITKKTRPRQTATMGKLTKYRNARLFHAFDSTGSRRPVTTLSDKGPWWLKSVEFDYKHLYGKTKKLPYTTVLVAREILAVLIECPSDMIILPSSDARLLGTMMPKPHWIGRTAHGQCPVQFAIGCIAPAKETYRTRLAHWAHMCNGPARQSKGLSSHRNIRQCHRVVGQRTVYAPSSFVDAIEAHFHAMEITARWCRILAKRRLMGSRKCMQNVIKK